VHTLAARRLVEVSRTENNLVTNYVVRRFLNSIFSTAKSAHEVCGLEHLPLLSPNVLTFTLDFRGVLEYHGINESAAGICAWAEHFHLRGHCCAEYLMETTTRVFVKICGDVEFFDPDQGMVSSKAAQHYCSAFFEIEGELIVRLEIRLQRESAISRHNDHAESIRLAPPRSYATASASFDWNK
jgi:hypothetical protein